jgi:hypothetical protein
MKQGEFDQTKPINPDLLLDELQAALGAKLLRLDTGIQRTVGFVDKTMIVVVVADDATEDDLKQVETIIESHKSEGLSKRQQRDKEKIEAEERFKAADFKTIRELTGKAQMDALFSLLEDIHKILRKDE